MDYKYALIGPSTMTHRNESYSITVVGVALIMSVAPIIVEIQFVAQNRYTLPNEPRNTVIQIQIAQLGINADFDLKGALESKLPQSRFYDT